MFRKLKRWYENIKANDHLYRPAVAASNDKNDIAKYELSEYVRIKLKHELLKKECE